MAPNTHWARILDTPHEYSDTSSTHGAACNDPTMTSGGDQQLISGKLSRFFDEESRCSNMSSCSMHALTLRMMSFLTVRALSPRLQARGTNVRARRVGGARPCTWQAISTLKTTNAGPSGTSTASLTIKRLLSLKAAKCPGWSRMRHRGLCAVCQRCAKGAPPLP